MATSKSRAEIRTKRCANCARKDTTCGLMSAVTAAIKRSKSKCTTASASMSAPVNQGKTEWRWDISRTVGCPCQPRKVSGFTESSPRGHGRDGRAAAGAREWERTSQTPYNACEMTLILRRSKLGKLFFRVSNVRFSRAAQLKKLLLPTYVCFRRFELGALALSQCHLRGFG